MIAGILLLLISNYLSFQAGQTLLYYRVASQASRASTREEKTYGVNQVLRFAVTRLDMGLLPPERQARKLVPFRNTTAHEVRLRRVTTSCACTMASLRPTTIPPAGNGLLEVVLDPRLASSEFAVSVSVEYQGMAQVDRLLVSGEVEKPVHGAVDKPGKNGAAGPVSPRR
jgi:hypothetical protein